VLDIIHKCISMEIVTIKWWLGTQKREGGKYGYRLMEIHLPWSIVNLLVNIKLGFYAVLLDFIVIFIELMTAPTRISRWYLWTVTITQCNLFGLWKLQIWPFFAIFTSLPFLCSKSSFYCDYLHTYTFVNYIQHPL
jgi:hypothetical protein